MIGIHPVGVVFLDARVGGGLLRSSGKLGKLGSIARIAAPFGEIDIAGDIHELVPDDPLAVGVERIDECDSAGAVDLAFGVVEVHHGTAQDGGDVAERIGADIADNKVLGGAFRELGFDGVAVRSRSGGGSGWEEAIVLGDGCGFLCGADGVHQALHLIFRQWAAEVAHDPADVEDAGAVLVDVVHEENSVAEAGHGGLHFTALKLAAARADRAFEAVEQSSFVALGLQAADPPGADVRQRFVVEIHRVLRGEQHAEAEGASLLQEDHHRLLRRRHGGGRQVAVDLVHVEEGAEGGGALLSTHPAE